jgi:hypothetical protein
VHRLDELRIREAPGERVVEIGELAAHELLLLIF